MAFKDYSEVPADNTQLGDGTYIGPNMLRNKVRPALQQIAADGKELADQVDAMAAGSSDAAFIATGSGAVSRTVLAKLRESTSIADFGGAGNGTTDDTTALANAIAAARDNGTVETEGKSFLVTSYDNPLGKRLIGGGGVLFADRGGTIRLDSYGDDGKVFIGKEYLYRVFLRIRNGGTLKGFIYGDSTVATAANGGGYAGANFEPHTLVTDYLIRAKGIRNNISLTNRGVGGTKVTDMNAIPDIDTVGGTTDLLIIKYGINDAADGLAGFATNLRAKLAAIRASSGYASVDNLAIILVGPNATYDPGHGRSSTWYEQLRGIYVQAARDYSCAYFDAYAYLRDIDWAATAAGSLMMDNPFADGQSVHPKEIMQTMLWGGLVDNLLSESELTPYLSDAWVALTYQNSWVDYGSGFQGGAYTQSRDGWVTLRGLIKSGTTASGTVIATLPTGFRPFAIEGPFEVTTAGPGRTAIRVETSGNIVLHEAGNATYTSLNGIRFKVRG